MDRTSLPGRTEVELAALQLQAIDAFNRARRVAEAAAAAHTRSREMRMDLDRRMAVLRAQHAAVVDRTQRSLEASIDLVRGLAAQRAVIAHRNSWFADRLAAALTAQGVEVIGRFENGAEAVGAAVAEQPEIVVVEDRLAMISGVEVVREVRGYVPSALIAAQVAYDDGVAPMLQAGASRAYTRRVPPLDVSIDLVRLLTEARQPA